MRTTTSNNRSSKASREAGFRSGLEVQISKQLEAVGVEYSYEELVVKYTQPAKPRSYKPDFVLSNGIIIEGKGRFEPKDREKHLLVREQNPGLDIRFVFSNSNDKISKGSKTSYADWCNKHGFKFSDKRIPMEWINETK